jgi:hypothetical protein
MSLFSFSRFITSLNYLCETISVTQRVASGLWETRTAYPSRAPGFTPVYFMGSVFSFLYCVLFFFGLVCFLFALGYVHNIAYISGLPILDCPFSFLERCFTIRVSLDVLSYTCLPPLLVFYSYIIATTRLRSRENICQLLQTDRWNSVVMCRRLEL